METESVNIWAVLVAALANFLIGGVWYSPALFCIIMATNLAFFLAGPDTTLAFAIGAGLAAGLGWAAMGLGVVALFERRPASYILINGGYLTVSFTVMGAILGAWR